MLTYNMIDYKFTGQNTGRTWDCVAKGLNRDEYNPGLTISTIIRSG
jgi:hypothetical protein